MIKNNRLNLKNSMLGVILALAWPTMLEQLMQTTVQYVDTAMVGVLGTEATAAVGSTGTVNWLVGSTTTAIGIGFLAFIAKNLGAGDNDTARKASAQSVTIVLIVGTFLTLLTTGLSPFVPIWMRVDKEIQSLAARYFLILYLPMLPRTATAIFGMVLRSSGDSKTPMVIGILSNVINVVLNFMLIYPSRYLNIFGTKIYMIGAGLGVEGAAIASAIAFAIGGLLITVALWKHKTISPRGYSIVPDKQVLKPCFNVALPNMFQRFFTSFGYVVFASMINSVGDVATASHTIANTVESLFYIPGYGMNTAASTLAGNAFGANDNKKMKELARVFIPIEIGLMIVSGGLLFAFAPALVGLFSTSKEVITLGSTVLRMVALSEPFYGFSIIIEGFLLGVGKTKLPFMYNVIGMWAVRIVGTFIFINLLGQGLIAAWGCMIAHNLLLFVMYLITYIKGSWNPLNKMKNAEL